MTIIKIKVVINMSNRLKVLICIVLLILGFSLSYFFTKKEKVDGTVDDGETFVSEKVDDECTEEYLQLQNITTVSATEEKLSSNAILILKKYYKNCDHTLNEYVELPQELVNMTENEVKDYYKDWEVIGFEKSKLTLYKEFDDTCDEHFKLKIENGKVVVYVINDDGIESVYEKTNISSEYLTETDLLSMQNGLEIYGQEELNQIIEDFE